MLLEKLSFIHIRFVCAENIRGHRWLTVMSKSGVTASEVLHLWTQTACVDNPTAFTICAFPLIINTIIYALLFKQNDSCPSLHMSVQLPCSKRIKKSITCSSGPRTCLGSAAMTPSEGSDWLWWPQLLLSVMGHLCTFMCKRVRLSHFSAMLWHHKPPALQVYKSRPKDKEIK